MSSDTVLEVIISELKRQHQSGELDYIQLDDVSRAMIDGCVDLMALSQAIEDAAK